MSGWISVLELHHVLADDKSVPPDPVGYHALSIDAPSDRLEVWVTTIIQLLLSSLVWAGDREWIS